MLRWRRRAAGARRCAGEDGPKTVLLEVWLDLGFPGREVARAVQAGDGCAEDADGGGGGVGHGGGGVFRGRAE